MDLSMQIIHLGTKWKSESGPIVISSINAPKSLDEFDINILDLNSSSIWQYSGDKPVSINKLEDLIHLSSMIQNSKMSKIIIILPQNLSCSYFQTNNGYNKSIELKNNLHLVQKKIINETLHYPDFKLFYENTETKISNTIAKASFYFDEDQEIITFSEKSKKTTTILCRNAIISTVQLDSIGDIQCFLKEVGIIEEKEKVPEWIENINILDDEKQKHIISENTERIKDLRNEIMKSRERIDSNNFYKSILYSSGDELVNVVFTMLEQILDIDMKLFEDIKKEDFIIDLDEVIFIGEIKGIASNIKSTNITQLELHYHSFIERKSTEIGSKYIKQILIICHQRNIPLNKRQNVDVTQINLAKRNESLIIESHSLLKIYQDFINKEINRKKIISLFRESTGLFQYD